MEPQSFMFLKALRWPQNLAIQTQFIPTICPRLLTLYTILLIVKHSAIHWIRVGLFTRS